jgi:hypothetical protein
MRDATICRLAHYRRYSAVRVGVRQMKGVAKTWNTIPGVDILDYHVTQILRKMFTRRHFRMMAANFDEPVFLDFSRSVFRLTVEPAAIYASPPVNFFLAYQIDFLDFEEMLDELFGPDNSPEKEEFKLLYS